MFPLDNKVKVNKLTIFLAASNLSTEGLDIYIPLFRPLCSSTLQQALKFPRNL